MREQTAPKLVVSPSRIPRYLAFADSIPPSIAKHGIRTFPAFFRFSERETPYFWSRARGMVFLAAMLMHGEVTFKQFFEASQELIAQDGLTSRLARADHFFRIASEPWLKERPKTSDDFLRPDAVRKLILELLQGVAGVQEQANPPSAKIVQLEVQVGEASVAFVAKNLEPVPVKSKQEGIGYLTWWHRTGQIAYELFGELVDTLIRIDGKKLPLTMGTEST